MVRLRESDFRTGLELLGAMQEASRDVASFARAGVERLPRLVASEFTTLSICHLASGRREVYGLPAGALSADERAAFDRHFHRHPLVRFQAQTESPKYGKLLWEGVVRGKRLDATFTMVRDGKTLGEKWVLAGEK